MGHIRETPDDKMDWTFYYSEGIPKSISNEEWRKRIGNRGWEILHGAIDNYPCSLCREPGSRLMHGLHDVVNVHTGKPVMYPKDLIFLYEQTELATRKVKQLNFSPRVVHSHAPVPVVVA